ncbi:MAG: GatB/YqeY domain-containing protein [Candidatus Moranbacteria bacterium]|nr:GatB/YqeY domain-containing protein [Candidatus Moranbacteria bacterium]
MSIKEKIRSDLKDAMKARETEKRDVLRMLDSSIKNAEIEKGKREEGLNDEEVIELVSRAIKQRKESSEQYKKGGREDLAEKEGSEIEFLSEYLPEQLSEDELRKIISDVISEVGATSKADMGKVMGATMGRVKGQADGNLVKKLLEEIL